MFRVERPLLLEKIVAELGERSVVLTGSPGIGKTWLIAQVARRLKAAKRPYLPLIAEDYHVHSVEELEKALALETNLISLLRGLGPGCVLIIDGMDALRSDISQRPFRQLVEAVTAQVPQCAVLVSVRTFDLQQSNALQRLFFGVSSSNLRPFKEVIVDALSHSELDSVAQQVPALSHIINDPSSGVGDLIRVPFNLHLCLQLLNHGSSWQELSVAQSQTQLMGLYWDARINRSSDAIQRRSYLRGLLRKMVEDNTLSLPQEAVETPDSTTVINELQSDEIVRASATSRISFTHNILFDYAVARLLLDETSFRPFVEEDASRSLFFRPSLVFFLTFLWLRDRPLFWKVSFDVFVARTLPERMRVIVATAIYESATSIDDLKPLLTSREETSDVGITSLLRAVHAFDGIQTSKKPLWLTLLAELASNPRLVFVNEFLALLNRAEQFADSDGTQSAARSARRFLTWIFDQADSMPPNSAAELGDIGVGRLLPFVIKTYPTDAEASRQIILRILTRVGLQSSGPHEASRLAHELNALVRFDAYLAVEVYERLFGHSETSKETTALGGPVFQMRSTRKQDFELSHYNLQTSFRAFLDISPIDAARAAIKSVNAEVAREHGSRDEDKKEFSFIFLGREVRFISDHSEIWDRRGRDHTSLQLLDASLTHAAKLLGADETQVTGTAMIQEIGAHVHLAVCWKRLLEAGRRNAEALFFAIKDLLVEPLVLAAPETTIEAGEVLKTAYKQIAIPDGVGLAIEDAILRIDTASIIERYEKPTSIRNRLLLCIPSECLRSGSAIALRSNATLKARDNQPYHRLGFGALSPEDAMRLRGVDPDDPKITDVLEKLRPLEEFERLHMNDVPSISDCLPLEKHIRDANALLGDEHLTEEFADRIRGAMCAVAEAAVKNPKWKRDDTFWQECRSILLNGAHDPVPAYDERYHEQFDHPAWGGPSPRIESAQGLTHIVWNWGLDDEVVRALHELLSDRVPAVRYQVATGLFAFYKHGAKSEFLRMASLIIDTEPTVGVMRGVLQSAGGLADVDRPNLLTFLRQVISRGFLTREPDDVADYVIDILVWLYVNRDDSSADTLLREIEENVLLYDKAVLREIFAAAAYFRSGNPEELAACGRARNVFLRIVESVYAIWSLDQDPRQADRERPADLYAIVDQIATRLRFSFRPEPSPKNNNAGESSHERALYFALRPILELLTEKIESCAGRALAAPTAHYLMEMFNAVLEYDPASVIDYAAAVCRAASRVGYNFDQMAISEAVKFAQQVMADHKDTLRGKASASALGDILDVFVRAGWPEAVRMAFLVDEAVR